MWPCSRGVSRPRWWTAPGAREDEPEKRAHHGQKQHAVVRPELGDLVVVDRDDLVGDLVEEERDARGEQPDQKRRDDPRREQPIETGGAVHEEERERDAEREPRDQQVADLGPAEVEPGDPSALQSSAHAFTSLARRVMPTATRRIMRHP